MDDLRTANLAEQELRVLELISAGYANKEIAIELALSLRSVERIVTAILRKLEAPNRTIAAIKYRSRLAGEAREVGG